MKSIQVGDPSYLSSFFNVPVIYNFREKVGEFMTTDHRIPLISATGSTRMGRIVGATVAERFGKSLLE